MDHNNNRYSNQYSSVNVVIGEAVVGGGIGDLTLMYNSYDKEKHKKKLVSKTSRKGSR